MRDFGEEWLNRDMANSPKEEDPTKVAFLAALEKKKSQGTKGTSAGTTADRRTSSISCPCRSARRFPSAARASPARPGGRPGWPPARWAAADVRGRR